MPTVPTWLADTMETVFSGRFHPTRVMETEYLHPNLKRVRFGVLQPLGIAWVPGQQVEFRVSPSDYRHYTPYNWNAAGNHFDILFYLHGKGPGSHWANGLRADAEQTFLGPAGNLTVNRQATSHVFLGDETAMGLFIALQNALPARNRIAGAFECEPGLAHTKPHILDIEALPKQGPNGVALLNWLSGYTFSPHTAFYLAGHAQSIQALRRHLMANGVRSNQIKAKAYWANNKTGL